MMCACPEGIGALTSPKAGGCGLRAPLKRYWLADRIDVSARAAPGATVNVRLDGAPVRDPQGRHAHVVGVEFKSVVNVVTGDTTNEAVPGYNLLTKFSNIFLEDASGWQYLAGVSGVDLVDDVWMRNHRLTPIGFGSDGLEANVGTAQANAVDVTLFFPFVRMDAFNPSLRGCLPLAAIKDRGDQALRFTVANFITETEALTNITDGGFQGTIEVWLHLVYLPVPFITSGWQLESYALDDTSGRVRHADRMHEYLAIRPRPWSSDDLEDYGGITWQVGNETFISALSAAEMTARDQAIMAGDLFAIPDEALGPLYLVIDRSRSKKAMPAGPVTFNYSSRGDSSTRYLHRTVACYQPQRMNELARTVACNPAQTVALPVDEKGARCYFRDDPAADALLVRAPKAA